MESLCPGLSRSGPTAPNITLHACVHAHELWALLPPENIPEADTTETLWTDIEQSTMGFCLFCLLSAVALCLSHRRDETCHCHPELLKELKPWCLTSAGNFVAARLPWGFLFPSGSAILLWYDPENANGSDPMHWLECLLKFNVQDHALD